MDAALMAMMSQLDGAKTSLESSLGDLCYQQQPGLFPDAAASVFDMNDRVGQWTWRDLD
jgi:hypothetical protein